MNGGWVSIPGFRGKYQINPMGHVRRVYEGGGTRMMHPFLRNPNGKKNRGTRYVKLTIDGKSKRYGVTKLMIETFYGGYPAGHRAIHLNGLHGDDSLGNLKLVSAKELGTRFGGDSKRRPVRKVDRLGNALDFYSSARQAARENNYCYQSVMDRCNGKIKKPFEATGYSFEWDDDGRRHRNDRPE